MSINKELVTDLRKAEQRIAELEATIAELEKEQQELVYDCRDYRIKSEKLEATIAEYKQLADPLTKALYKEMSERHTAVCLENKELREAATNYLCNDNPDPSNQDEVDDCEITRGTLVALLEKK